MAGPRLIPELVRHMALLSERLGALRVPLHAYIAGGIAVNYHTGVRMSDDVDIQWSHRVLIPTDMHTFDVSDPNDPEEVHIVTLDSGFNDAIGSFHPDWKIAAPVIAETGDIVIHVITPLDLAVSKLARYSARDREDIAALARFGLIRAAEVNDRAKEALEFVVGNTTFVEYNIRDAVNMIREMEAGRGTE